VRKVGQIVKHPNRQARRQAPKSIEAARELPRQLIRQEASVCCGSGLMHRCRGRQVGNSVKSCLRGPFRVGQRPQRFHKGAMNILSGCFDQPDKSPISAVSERRAVLNNDRKVGLIEENAHSLQYTPRSTRMPAEVASF
jgi:hypothetical protein